MPHGTRGRGARPAAVVVAVVSLGVIAASPAEAHIQVTPTVAAPGDAVRFTFLVPNERDTSTSKIQVAVPKGVLAFSFADVAGWKRSVTPAPDGSTGTITWTGHLASDGFVEFSMLASTPTTPQDLTWKALQFYQGDPKPVRWIGTPDSQFPAAVTHLRPDAAQQNAGGGGVQGAAAPSAAASGTPPQTSPQTSPRASSGIDSSASDPVARTLGGVAAAAALGALGLSLASRRRRRP